MVTATKGAPRFWYPLHFQATYFLKEPIQPISLEYLGLLQSIFLPKNQGAPMVIPFPEDMPPEVPRAVLRADDDSSRIEVSLNRTNVHIYHPKGAPLGAIPEIELRLGRLRALLFDLQTDRDRLTAQATTEDLADLGDGALASVATRLKSRAETATDDDQRVAMRALEKLVALAAGSPAGRHP